MNLDMAMESSTGLMERTTKASGTSTKQKDKELSDLREFANAFKKLNPSASEYADIDGEIARLSSVEEFRLATAQAISAIE